MVTTIKAIKVELSDAVKAAKAAAADAAEDEVSDTTALLWALESFCYQSTSIAKSRRKLLPLLVVNVVACMSLIYAPLTESIALLCYHCYIE